MTDTTSLANPRILQIFNRYLEYGGEEGSVGRIADLLRNEYELDTYYGSTEDQLARPFGKWRMAGWMIKNGRVLGELRGIQSRGKFDLWQIHNVFPAVSVATYGLAFELGIPIIQYLHNYRFSCAAATHFRDGSPCTECKPGHFLPAIRHRCWRGSLPATFAMTLALYRFWHLDPARSIQAFVAISADQKQRHVEIGLPADKIHVVHHFLEAGTAPDHTPPPDGEVLFLGRLVPEKGLHLLLDAWSKISNRGRTLRIVGDGPEMPALRQKIESMNLRNVILDGFVPREQHADLWKRCAFFVAPSVWREPFGMVVLEAWRQARPVLATNLGSFPELIQDGKTGWLADPNPDAFAHTLQTALDAGNSYTGMGEAGRRELVEQFNSRRWIDQISRVYQSVLSR